MRDGQLLSKLNTAVMKRHIMDYQGLFLKQYGAQRLSLLLVYHKMSSFLFPASLHMYSTVQVSSEC